jgi:superfamily II DNA helicase RecQ
VAVDELHLVALWGSGIRPQYAQLSLLRRRLEEASLGLPALPPWTRQYWILRGK